MHNDQNQIIIEKMEKYYTYRKSQKASLIKPFERNTPIKITKTDSDEDQPTWCQVKAPSQQVHCRYYHSSVLYQKKLYIYGGFQTNRGILSDFKVFGNFQNDASWDTLTTQNGPGPRYSHSSVYYQGQIYIFGGKINVIENSNQIYSYSLSQQKWRKINPKNMEEGPPPLDSHKSVICQNQMIVVGGFLLNKDSMNIYSLNLDSVTWKTLYRQGSNEIQPKSRSDFSLIERDKKLYIFSGKSSDCLLADFWQFSLQTNQFKEILVDSIKLQPRSGHSALLYNNKMVVFGGITGVTHERNDLLFYDFDEGKWHIIWQNQASKKDKNLLENFRLNLSKKKSIKPTHRQNQKKKTTFRVIEKPTTTLRKYRRPLRQELTQREFQERKTQVQLIKKYNERKMIFLTEFEASPYQKFNSCSYSPLMQALSNSILITSNKTSLTKTPRQQQAMRRKNIKPRDGHSMDVIDKLGKMVIFGGDRHTIGNNDVVIVDLRRLIK